MQRNLRQSLPLQNSSLTFFAIKLKLAGQVLSLWLANCYGRGDFTGNRAAQVNWLSLSERIRW